MSTLFREFVDKKQREAKKHLVLLEKVFKSKKLECKSFLNDDFPYLFVKATNPSLSFEGVRIYEIGDMIAYRIAKREDTEPYGTAYRLNLESMYNDYMAEDDMSAEKAGQKVIESVVKEIKTFFNNSSKAEDENKDNKVTIVLKPK